MEIQGLQYNCLQQCISKYIKLYTLNREQPTEMGELWGTLFSTIDQLDSTERHFWTVPMNLSFLCQELVKDRQLNLESSENLKKYQKHILNRELAKPGTKHKNVPKTLRLWKAAHNGKQFNGKVSLEKLGVSKESLELALLKKVGYNEYTWPTKSLFELHKHHYKASLWYNKLHRFLASIFRCMRCC